MKIHGLKSNIFMKLISMYILFFHNYIQHTLVLSQFMNYEKCKNDWHINFDIVIYPCSRIYWRSVVKEIYNVHVEPVFYYLNFASSRMPSNL